MQKITISITVHAPLEKVWAYWTEPEHITQWNAASDDWHTPRATNDVRVGGQFTSRMESRDGAHGFDFDGTYTEVVPLRKLAYRMGEELDAREVEITFEQQGENVVVSETFDTEDENSAELQRAGWQAIMDRFKAHVEAN